MALYELIEQPDLEDPLLVLALDGWIDARLAAAGAAEVLCDQLDTITVARFSTDEIDFRWIVQPDKDDPANTTAVAHIVPPRTL